VADPVLEIVARGNIPPVEKGRGVTILYALGVGLPAGDRCGGWSREERADVDRDAGGEDRRERSGGQPLLQGIGALAEKNGL
jgi:hypothetical protein